MNIFPVYICPKYCIGTLHKKAICGLFESQILTECPVLSFAKFGNPILEVKLFFGPELNGTLRVGEKIKWKVTF